MNLIFTGDLMLGGDFLNEEISEHNFNIDLLNYLKKSKLIISNFENVIGQSNDLRPDKSSHLYCSLKTFKSYINLFSNSIFCLANNHITDFGEVAFDKTLLLFNKFKVKYLGAGKLNEVRDFLEIGNNIFILNLSTSKKNVNSKIATNTEIGCLDYENSVVEKIIKARKSNNSFLIISVHWGYENVILPSPEQIKFAHKFIDLGADFVIGHHPHIIQPYEIYRNKYIFYSLGNYFFPNFYYTRSGNYHKWNKNNDRSICISVELNQEVSKIKIMGLKFDRNKFYVNIDKSTKDVLIKISRIFKRLSQNNNYQEFFENYLNNHYPVYLMRNTTHNGWPFFSLIRNQFKKQKFSFLERLKKFIRGRKGYFKKQINIQKNIV